MPTATMQTRADVERRASDILEAAMGSPDQRELQGAHAFGSPSAFWNAAVAAGLASPEERDEAHRVLGGYAWSFSGD